jgi:NADH-quinone oxidoreductase subunit G
MTKTVTLTIDGKTVTVPQGTLVVDAAKKIGIDIPVFCYHPKMEPVGMCRMCLVELGRPVMDRATNQPVLEMDGSPKIQYMPKLDTACTTPATEGMVVLTQTKKVADARRDVVEFILTSHPLDCPVCDKGGECPLQNLTMGYGPGQSRFEFGEKMHLAKHVPLGDLIYLDRERCIQCGRCVRFQKDLAGDPVIGFTNRGRSLEIITESEPGFDSIFSGNTTDICPVGALTSADFRFGARPWEMKPVASICTHCPVGCNLTLNVRREAGADGKLTIKRVMPRQNEAVNEIWMCDKGRFGYHFTESKERLTQPLVRKNNELVPATWEEAIDVAVSRIKSSFGDWISLAGGRLSNEDLFNLRKLNDVYSGKALLNTQMGGGDMVSQIGLASGSNLAALGAGSTILVIASDLHEDAPIWWLRLKAAAARGATLIVASARPTRLDAYASKVIRYQYGEELAVIQKIMDGAEPAFTDAENAIIFFGNDGLDMLASTALAQSCSTLLISTNHFARPNNGLVAVWPHANTQGAWDMGFRPSANLARSLSSAGVLYIAGADPAGDDPVLAAAVDKAGFVIVQELFLTETARKADVVFPVQAFTEREGTFTSGERRVQRYYQAVYPAPGLLPDFAIIAQIAQRFAAPLESRAASLVFLKIAAEVGGYSNLDYSKLAENTEQWPIVGRSDLYYGGTTYENKSGVGVAIRPACETPDWHAPAAWTGKLPDRIFDLTQMNNQGLTWIVPVNQLYDQGQTIQPTQLLRPRQAKLLLSMSPLTAFSLGLEAGDIVEFEITKGISRQLPIRLDSTLPAGVALFPRSSGLPVSAPFGVRLQKIVVRAHA